MYVVKPRWDAERRAMAWLVLRGHAIISRHRTEDAAVRTAVELRNAGDPWLAYQDARQRHFDQCYLGGVNA